MAETVYDLRQPSFFTTTFPAKSGSSFFFPLGNSSLCNCKRESDQNPEQTQPNSNPTQAITSKEVKGLLQPHLLLFERFRCRRPRDLLILFNVS